MKTALLDQYCDSPETPSFSPVNDLGSLEIYYFNARWYNPQSGRFISEDPIRDGANWYTYCFNNPQKFIDPTGLMGDAAALAAAEDDYYDDMENSDSPYGHTEPNENERNAHGDGDRDSRQTGSVSDGVVQKWNDQIIDSQVEIIIKQLELLKLKEKLDELNNKIGFEICEIVMNGGILALGSLIGDPQMAGEASYGLQTAEVQLKDAVEDKGAVKGNIAGNKEKIKALRDRIHELEKQLAALNWSER